MAQLGNLWSGAIRKAVRSLHLGTFACFLLEPCCSHICLVPGLLTWHPKLGTGPSSCLWWSWRMITDHQGTCSASLVRVPLVTVAGCLVTPGSKLPCGRRSVAPASLARIKGFWIQGLSWVTATEQSVPRGGFSQVCLTPEPIPNPSPPVRALPSQSSKPLG